MAFATSGVRYDFQGTKLSIDIPIDSESPTLTHLDAAMTAFCDELDNQGGGATYVIREVRQSDQTGTFWTAPT